MSYREARQALDYSEFEEGRGNHQESINWLEETKNRIDLIIS